MSELSVLPDLPVRPGKPPVTAAPGRERQPSAFRRQLQALADDHDRADRPSAGQAATTGTRGGENRQAPVGREAKSSASEQEIKGSDDGAAEPAPIDSNAGAAVLASVAAAPPPPVPVPAGGPLPAGTVVGVPEGGRWQGIAVEVPGPRSGVAAISPSQGIMPAAAATGETEGTESLLPQVSAGDPRPGGVGEGKLPPAPPMRAADGAGNGSGPAVPAATASVAPAVRPSEPFLLAPASPAESPADRSAPPEAPVGAERRGFLSEQRFAQLLTVGREGAAPDGGAGPPQGGAGTGSDLGAESFTKPLLQPDTEPGATLEEGGEPLPGPFGRLIENAAHGERLAKDPALLLPSGRSVPEQSIVEQVLANIPLPRGNAPAHLRLRLQPEELGQVTVELVLEKEGLKAHVQVQNQQVLDVLEKYLPRLREALQEQGVRLEEMRLSTDPHGGSGGFARDRHPPLIPGGTGGSSVATGVSSAMEGVPEVRNRPGSGLSIRI